MPWEITVLQEFWWENLIFELGISLKNPLQMLLSEIHFQYLLEDMNSDFFFLWGGLGGFLLRIDKSPGDFPTWLW